MDSSQNKNSSDHISLAKELQAKGWYLTSEGVEHCLSNINAKGSKTSPADLIRIAVNENLKNIGAPCLPTGVSGSKVTNIQGNLVLQIQKVVNVAVPQQTDHEHSSTPRLLKIVLSDGHSTCQALEIEPHTEISIKTPPGTKIRLKKDVSIVHGFLFLKSGCIELLGGHVEKLVVKWTIAQSLLHHERPSQHDGAPQWVPFGQTVRASKDLLQPVKVEPKEEAPELKERNTEFEVQRRDAIAQAVKSGESKSFEGTGKLLVDSKVQKIMDAGFSLEQAEQTLRQTRYDVDRALQRLQFDTGRERGDRPDFPRGRGRRGRRGGRDQEDYENPEFSRPTGNVSLLEFLPGHVTAGVDIEEVAPPPRVADSTPQGYGSREDGRGYRGNRGERRGGRSDRRGGRRGRGDSFNRYNDSQRSYTDDRSKYSANQLVTDMESWPGLNEEPLPVAPLKQTEQAQSRTSFTPQPTAGGSGRDWRIQDYCLALHPTRIKHLPAVIQELATRTATVLFIETGDVEVVDLRNLKTDPQDDSRSSRPAPAQRESSRSNFSSGRIASRPRGSMTFHRGGRRPF